MLSSLAEAEKLPGRTVLLVDVSGSMTAPLSRRSEMLRTDAGYGLAVLIREVCEKAFVFTFSNKLAAVPPRRGFALRDGGWRIRPEAYESASTPDHSEATNFSTGGAVPIAMLQWV